MSSAGDTKAKAGGVAALLRRPPVLIGGALLLVALAGYLYVSKGPADIAAGTTFIAKRGDLDVIVVEGGAVQALESQEIVSPIKGNQGVKILSLVEEGYRVTPEDVAAGKVLVELDSADLKDRVVNQEIAYQSADAGYVEKKTSYDIQVNQNQSTITAAELKAKFALMDFEKYLGKKAVTSIISRLGLDTVRDKLEALKKAGGPKTEMPKETVALGVAPIPGGPNETSGADREASRKRMQSDVNGGERPERGSGAGNGGGRRAQGSRGAAPGSAPEGGAAVAAPTGAPGGGAGGAPGGTGPGGGGGRMDPERFKAMIMANGGKIPEEIASRMRENGMDPDEILKRMGITPGDGTPAPAPPVSTAPIAVDAIFVRDDKYMALRSKIDFTEYADVDQLEDGEAKQQLRQFKNQILVAQEDNRLAGTSLEGKQRLAEKDFITVNELDLEKVKVQKAEINVETTTTALSLYVNYTFVKTAEMLLSDYEEALSALERTMQEASAKLAQADAAFKSAEQRYNLEKSQLEDLKDQLSKCVIKAERPGLVVYGSSTESNPFRRSSEEPIQEGTTVRERQKIITIPDMTKMGVKVSIHESAVQRIAPGQTVRLRIDAFADRPLTGTVDRVAVLADSANMFMNPDLKVYPTTIKIEGIYDWLRPGMSAEVEILTGTVKDTVYIPIQAVTYAGEQQVCYVVKGGSTERRTVTTGAFTEDFIEIKNGLNEGEEVLLLAPNAGKQDQMDEKKSGENEEEAPAKETAPA